MKIPFPFKNSSETTSSWPWPWPSCGNPKTLSFRAGNDMYKTINSAYVDATGVVDSPHPYDQSWFTKSFESTTEEEEEEEYYYGKEPVIRGLRSERLFFEARETSSIMEVGKRGGFAFKESTVVMEMDSDDPYLDFKKSMEEMVEAHGLKEWECLEELLSWYLRVNAKTNHGYIVGAFVDLLIPLANFAFASSTDHHHHLSFSAATTTTITHSLTLLSFSSSASSTSTPCIFSLEAEDEIQKKPDNVSS